MSSTLPFFINLSASAKNSQAQGFAILSKPAKAEFVVRDNVRIEARFMTVVAGSRTGVMADLGASAVLSFGGKLKSTYTSSNTYLFFASELVRDASNPDDIFFYADLDLNTDEFIAAFSGTSGSAEVICEFQVEVDGRIQTVAQFDGTGVFDVIRGGEGGATPAVPPLPTAPVANTFLGGNSAGTGWVQRTAAQAKTLLAVVVADISDFATGVRAVTLTGLSLATATAVSAADSVLTAIGKLQAQVTLRAPLASPALTGTPTAPTAAAGTNTTQLATTAFVNMKVDTLANARGPRQALVFDGTASASMAVANAGKIFTWAFYFQPTTLPDNGFGFSLVIFVGASGSGGAITNASGQFALFQSDGVVLSFSNASLVLGVGYFITIESDGTTVSYYINGVLDSTRAIGTYNPSQPITTLGDNPRSLTNKAPFVFGGFYPYNYALSAAQVARLFATGAPDAVDRGGGERLTGDASTFTGGAGGWTSFNGATVNATGGKLVVAASINSGVSLPPIDLFAGQTYEITFTVSGASGNASRFECSAITGNPFAISANGTFTYQFVPTSTVLSAVAYFAGNGGVSGYELDNVTLKAFGTIAQYDFSGVGPQIRDVNGTTPRADINLPGDGVTGGVSRLLAGGTAGDFGETRTASGYALGRDAVVIPEGYRIARIWVSGDGTFSLGNAASGTEIVNAFTATGTTQPATLAAYVTSSRKLYLTLGTATTVTYSVHLERI